MRFKIYHKGETEAFIEVEKLTYSDEWMGEEFVTVSVSSETPVDWRIGDYIIYRGQEYTLSVIPATSKQARRNSVLGAFSYEGVKFRSCSDELTRCKFLDVVPRQNTAYYTGLTDFNFYCPDVNQLAERIQANLDRLYTENRWTVTVANAGSVKNKVVSVSNIYCWEALALVESEFDLNFVIRGRNIIIGDTGELLSRYFEYGKDKGLFKIERSTDDSQQVVTRLRAYGNTTNMPVRYYANVGLMCYIDLAEFTRTGTGQETDYMTLAVPADKASRMKFKNSISVESVNYTKYVFKVRLGKATGTVWFADNGNNESYINFTADIDAGTPSEMAALTAEYNRGERICYVLSNYDKDKWYTGWKVGDPDNRFPDNMNCRHLMLPGFPYKSLKEWADGKTLPEWDGKYSQDIYDPFIDSKNADALGIREATIFFDGSDDRDDIYPSIEWLKDGEGNALNVVKVGSTIEDDGVFDGNVSIPNFKITIADIGFNPMDYADGTPTISMKDGMCGGREFEIVGAKKVSLGYELTLKRLPDSSLDLYFPYRNFQIREGDKFVLLNIEMPSVYVDAASEELLRQAKEWLAKNDYVVYKYSLSVDELFMQRQHDAHIANNEDSLHDTIKAGSVLHFEDADLDIVGAITIDKLEIKEGEYLLPQYSVTLSEDKTVGTLQRMQQQIDSIASGRGGGGYTASEIDTMIRNVGAKHFLSKQNDDTAKGKITFDKGADFGKFVTGISGQGAKIDKKGDAEVQNLRVWKSMTVTELRFDRASVLLGTNIQTYCGGVIKKVEITGENSGFIDLETDEEANGEIEGGIGSVQNGALCVGYYHDIKGGNDTDDADDFKGTIKYKGTKCVQFAIDWKEEGETGYSPADLPNATTTRHIRYELREGTTQHPVEGMTFKGTGNMKDPSLGYFAISTPKYTAKYAFVTSWEWDAAQCIVEVGGADISGFGSIVGENWTSPKQGTICTNLYTRGVINQVTNDKRYLYVTQDSNGMLKPGESEKITMVVRDSYFHNRTQEFSFKLNGETVENLGEEAVAHVSFDELDNEFNEVVITATDGKKHLIEQTIKIRKLLDGLRLDAGKAAIGEELTASVLRYHGTTRVTNGFLWYEIDNGGLVSYTEGTEVRLASTNKKITFWWYEDEMRLKLIAKLELPVVKNGEDGKDGVDGESAYVIITDREVVKPDEESTLVYFDGFKAAVQWDGGAPVGVTNESIVVRACRCRGNKESNEGSFIYRLDGGEAHAMTNGGSVTVEKKSGIKSVTFCWLAENGATLAQKIVYVVLDGESPVFADLDNEMDSIVTDKDGNFEGSVVLSTNVAMFHGLTRLSPTITAASATGITSSVEGERVSFEVTQAAADRNEMDITLTAVIEDVTYTRHLTFTIVKQRKGNTGDPAVVYSLAPSYSAIKVDKYGNRVVKSIVCNVAKTTGKDESVLLDSLPEGMKVKWQMDDDSSVSESSTIPTINVSAVKNQLVLMLDYDGTIIDRETIPVMSDAVESFKEMVFKRQGSTPSKPSGCTFASPIPTGWSDGIPSGEEQVWTSSRTFYSDNRSTADWTDPVQLSDTADFDVCYHADEAKPTLLPTSHHTEDQGNGWHNTATEKDWWMATDIKKNGVWQGWKVSRIKGEKGNSFDEAKYYFKSTPRGANTPSVSLSAGVPDGWSTNIAETHWGEKVSNDFHYWLWQVIVETVMDNVGNKTYKAQSAQMIDEYDPKKTGVAETYCANNDANNHPTSDWTTLSSARANFGKNNQYLWKREVRTYSDGSNEAFYSIFQKYVEDGKSAYEIWLDNGNEGTEADFLKSLNGRAVANVKEWYGVSASDNERPSQWFENSIPKGTHNETNKYLWNKEQTIDQKGVTIVETTPVIIAVWTKDGKGISSITEYYLATSADSGITISTAGWTTTVQKIDANKRFLWNYEKITYSEGNPTYTTPAIIGVYGDKGDTGAPGKRGRMLRPCGVWSASKTYVNNDDYVDAVIHNGKFYAVKEDSNGGSVSISGAGYSPDTAYWEEANMLEFVATNLFFAETAHIRNLALVNMLAGYYDSNGEWISMIEIDGDGNLIIGDRTSQNILNINSNKIQILRSLGTGSTKLDLSPSGVAATNGEVGFSLSGSLLQLYVHNEENSYLVGIDHQGIHWGGTVMLWSEIANAVNSVKVKLVDSLPSTTEPNTLYIVK